MERVAIDIGGTFTDLVALDEGKGLVVAKVPTTPDDHAEGVLEAIARAGIDLSGVRLFVHGSTVAINTVIERKGARTALLTTEGFRDVYEIGRSNRPEAYNLFFEKPVPLVPRSLRGELRERLTALGQVHTPLDEDEAARLISDLRARGVQAVAVALLHSYANPAHEIAVGGLMGRLFPEAYLSLSHRILREYREYERTSTTVVNSYVGPVVSRYLESLASRLRQRSFGGRVLIMQSSGGVMSLEAAAESPVRTMESGPVAGVMGAAAVARSLARRNTIAFDMGGTTAKASLVKDGVVEITGGYFIGGYARGHPVMLPVVDIVEVGAGGGSIAWLDEAGGLKVGPVSAGAVPGPACYGRGGRQPTVTDANVVLGRLGARSFLGGEMPLDLDAAQAAIEREIAAPLRMSLPDAAAGIIRIANAQMSLAVRAVSVEKGQDPRDSALIAFGGAGPLHACELARGLHLPVVIVPLLPGQFSAYGMLQCELRRDYVQTLVRDFDAKALPELNAILASLTREGLDTIDREREAGSERPALQHSVDLRYRGQEFAINVVLAQQPLGAEDVAVVSDRFHQLHQSLYAHSAPGEPLELIAVRTTARAPLEGRGAGDPIAPPAGRNATGPQPRPHGKREVYLGRRHGSLETPLYARSGLAPGSVLRGPAIIEEAASTTVVFPDDSVTVAGSGELVIDLSSNGDAP